jgi:hypothetical protein
MSYEAPNILPAEGHDALEAEVDRVAEVAREADSQHQNDLFPDKHNSWRDGSHGHGSTRVLGQEFNSHKVEHRYGRFNNSQEARTDAHIRTDDRKVHSYSDRRYGSTATEMKVSRGGKEKTLNSDNPLVFNMLTRIALKDVEQKAHADIDQTSKKAA